MKRLLAVVVLFAGCAHVEQLAPRQSLLDTDRQFSAYSISNGAPAAFQAYMADDATLLPNGGNPVTGHPAIGETLAPLANGTLTWEPQQADVSHSGEIGYTWGTYEYRAKDSEGKPQVSHGKYLTVWRKQPDGSWKAVVDIGNKSPPPGP